MIRLALSLAVLVLTGAAAPTPATVRVRMETSLGPIVIDLDARHAPITTANFLAYVDEKRFDNTSFYRAARSKADPNGGLVQGGINHNARRARFPIPHEPTSRTGLRHVDGTISMARNDPGTAAGDFFITVGRAAYLDARPPNYVGYAAFGHVASGMAVVRRILVRPTYPGGFTANTLRQSLDPPVRIVSVRRVR